MNLNFTLFIEVLSFALLLFILSRLLYKPLLRLLDQRKSEIENSLTRSKTLEQEAQDKLKTSERILKEAKEQVLKIKERSEIEREEIKRDGLEQSRKEAERIIEEARDQIEKEMDQARQEVRKEASEISIQVAEKLLERSVDLKDHRRLVEQAIEELSKEKKALS